MAKGAAGGGGMNCKCECSPEIICYRIGLAADVIERRRSQRMKPARHERKREREREKTAKLIELK